MKTRKKKNPTPGAKRATSKKTLPLQASKKTKPSTLPCNLERLFLTRSFFAAPTAASQAGSTVGALSVSANRGGSAGVENFPNVTFDASTLAPVPFGGVLDNGVPVPAVPSPFAAALPPMGPSVDLSTFAAPVAAPAANYDAGAQLRLMALQYGARTGDFRGFHFLQQQEASSISAAATAVVPQESILPAASVDAKSNSVSSNNNSLAAFCKRNPARRDQSGTPNDSSCYERQHPTREAQDSRTTCFDQFYGVWRLDRTRRDAPDVGCPSGTP